MTPDRRRPFRPPPTRPRRRGQKHRCSRPPQNRDGKGVRHAFGRAGRLVRVSSFGIGGCEIGDSRRRPVCAGSLPHQGPDDACAPQDCRPCRSGDCRRKVGKLPTLTGIRGTRRCAPIGLSSVVSVRCRIRAKNWTTPCTRAAIPRGRCLVRWMQGRPGFGRLNRCPGLPDPGALDAAPVPENYAKMAEYAGCVLLAPVALAAPHPRLWTVPPHGQVVVGPHLLAVSCDDLTTGLGQRRRQLFRMRRWPRR